MHAQVLEEACLVARVWLLGSRGVDPLGVRDAPVDEHVHAVGERDGLVDIVGDEQDAEAVVAPQRK